MQDSFDPLSHFYHSYWIVYTCNEALDGFEITLIIWQNDDVLSKYGECPSVIDNTLKWSLWILIYPNLTKYKVSK